jgi:predicted nucleic acid-binding protein
MKSIGRGPVALDAVTFIYFIEGHPKFLRVVEPLFAAIDRGLVPAVTSALTILEVLVAPLRAGDRALADHHEAILGQGRGLRIVELDRPLLRAAAHLRAVTAIRTPDSIQLAAALGAGCTAFVTNDRKLPEIPGLEILQLDDHV